MSEWRHKDRCATRHRYDERVFSVSDRQGARASDTCPPAHLSVTWPLNRDHSAASRQSPVSLTSFWRHFGALQLNSGMPPSSPSTSVHIRVKDEREILSMCSLWICPWGRIVIYITMRTTVSLRKMPVKAIRLTQINLRKNNIRKPTKVLLLKLHDILRNSCCDVYNNLLWSGLQFFFCKLHQICRFSNFYTFHYSWQNAN